MPLARKVVIMLYGPPGSGKGTQANFVAAKLNLLHFDTGRFLESVVHDPNRQKEKIIMRERKLFDNGMLMTPSFVTREVEKQARRIWRNDSGLVFSGSPRTLYEAEHLVPFLENLYGRKNIFVFVLGIPPKLSIERNSHRLICSECKTALLTSYFPIAHPKYCPICAGPFYKRTLDKPGVIKIRLKEYALRTEPIFVFMKKRGYTVHMLDGRPEPYKVFRSIYGLLESSS